MRTRWLWLPAVLIVLIFLGCTAARELTQDVAAGGTPGATRESEPTALPAMQLLGYWWAAQFPCEAFLHEALPYSVEFFADGTYRSIDIDRTLTRGGTYDTWPGTYLLLAGNRVQLTDALGTTTVSLRFADGTLAMAQVDNPRRCAAFRRVKTSVVPRIQR